MNILPEEILLRVCYYLPVEDKAELSVVSKRFNDIVDESWQDFAFSKGWSNFGGTITWKESCKRYMDYRKMWFRGRYNEHKIYFATHGTRNQNVLTSLIYRNKFVGISTTRKLDFYNVSCKKRSGKCLDTKVFTKEMQCAENSLCASNTHISIVDELTSELVIIDLCNYQESRVQLSFNQTYDFFHVTDKHIVLLTNDGQIQLNTIGHKEIECIHEEKEEVSYSYVHDDWQLFVSFWSGKLVVYNINKPFEAMLCLELDHVMYAMVISSKHLYFGTADGAVGKLKLDLETTVSKNSVREFETMHCGSVYCIAVNKTMVVSGGSDSKIIFWSRQGVVRTVDHVTHVGVVRHIFLNDWIMISSGDAHSIAIWDPFSCKLENFLHRNPLKIKFMEFDGTVMVYGSPDSNYVIYLSVVDQ